MSMAVEGHLLIRKHAVEIASPQNVFGSPPFNNIHLTLSKRVHSCVLPTHSAVGSFLTILCLAIPFCEHSLLNSSENYSSPLSVLILFVVFPV